MLQYKVQSFIILYKPIFKFEKKIRLKFAKTNCIVYKNLNNKLIKFFSLYKSYLKKTSQPLSNLSINSVFSNISISKIDQSSKNFNIKPILNNKIIQKLINKKKNNFIKLQNLKYLNNISLAKDVFKLLFNIKFNSSYFKFFYNNLLKKSLKYNELNFILNKRLKTSLAKEILFKYFKFCNFIKLFFFLFIKFYFKQRINSISLYVLNFNIYRNLYFSKIDQSSKNFNIKPILNNKIIQKLINKKKNNFIKLQNLKYLNNIS